MTIEQQPPDYEDLRLQAAFNTGHSGGYAAAYEAFTNSFDHEDDCDCPWCAVIKERI